MNHDKTPPHVTIPEATKRPALWGACRHLMTVEHNHVICLCPPCRDGREPWFRCVLTDLYIHTNEISVAEQRAVNYP